MLAGWLSCTVTRTIRNTRSLAAVPLLSCGQPCTAESHEASTLACGRAKVFPQPEPSSPQTPFMVPPWSLSLRLWGADMVTPHYQAGRNRAALAGAFIVLFILHCFDFGGHTQRCSRVPPGSAFKCSGDPMGCRVFTPGID